jgi:hypothetical protein
LAEGNYSYREIFTWMAGSLGRSAPRWQISRKLLQVAGIGERLQAWMLGRPARITPDVVNSAFNTQHYAADKICKTLNFKFLPIKEFIQTAGRVYLEDLKTKRKS